MGCRVALFASSFLPYSQTFVFDEVRHHARYAVDVFTAERRNAERFPYDDVHVGGALYRWLNLAPGFSRRLRTRSYRLIHAHFGLGGTRAASFARRAGLPLVITFHGYDVPLLTSPTRLRPTYWGYALAARRALCRDMTLGLCASAELREMLVDYGVPAHRLRVWRLGVDLGAFRPAPRRPGPPRIAMIGRFVEKKGFPCGLRAFAELARRGIDAHLTIVGDGELAPQLRAIVDEQGLGARVTFAGVLSPPEVGATLRDSDILLAPSVTASDGDRESGLIVVKEASASGAVPVGTWHGGIHEIIDDGVTGFLVPERDVATTADRLARLVVDAPLRARLAAAARAKMEREYDVRARVAELEDIYDEVTRA